MVSELDKYRVEIFKIAGFALMTPFARIIVEPIVVFNELGLIMFIGYSIFVLLLFFTGFLLILKGCDILDIQKGK